MRISSVKASGEDPKKFLQTSADNVQEVITLCQRPVRSVFLEEFLSELKV